MSREIKFRVWNQNAKGWVLNNGNGEKFGVFGPLNTLTNSFREDGLVYQQFIGLKDSNGKEIYEGDIVECNDGLKGRIYGEVVYDQEYGAFRIAFTDILHWTFYRAENPEVIGNIFETPELLA